MERLQKVLSRSGVASRRAAEKLIQRDASNGLAQLALGVRALKQKNYAAARSQLQRGGRGRSADITATLLAAWAYSGSGETNRALETMGSPIVQMVLFGGVLSFSYHLLNGIRHLFWDAGYGFELPTARKSGWIVAIAAIVLALSLWFVLAAAVGGAA